MFGINVIKNLFPVTAALFIVSPSNVAVIAGERATLNCSKLRNKDTPLRWRTYNYHGTVNSTIAVDGEILEHFANMNYSIEKTDNNTTNLIIDVVGMSHAGRYGCYDSTMGSEDMEKSRTAELIVLGKSLAQLYFVTLLDHNVSKITVLKWCGFNSKFRNNIII